MREIRGVLFDAAGTLIRLTAPVGELYARWAAAAGAAVSPRDLDRVFPQAMAALTARRRAEPDRGRGDQSDWEWWREVVRLSFFLAGGAVPPEKEFPDLFDSFALPGRWALYGEAAGVLRRLKESGLKVGVLSNFDDRLPRILAGLEVDGLLDGLVYSAQEGREKPDPDLFRAGAHALGLAPREVIHVGDSYAEDYLGAREAGMAARLLDRAGRFTIRERISDLRPLPGLVGDGGSE